MIIWGGFSLDQGEQNTGGRYDPGTDSWTPTSTTNAPDPRYSHTAVWTGNQMIIWGGTVGTGNLNTGGRYNARTYTWMASSTCNAPSARKAHIAGWTGCEIIVW